jgi:hypothetical protein
VKIDSTVKFVLLGVKSHKGLLGKRFWVLESYLFRVWFRGALMSINQMDMNERYRTLFRVA